MCTNYRYPYWATVCAALMVASGCTDQSQVLEVQEVHAPQLTLEGSMVQRYTPPHPELARTLVVGRRGPEGHCVFAQSFKVEERKGERLEAIVEYDPFTCRYVVARLNPAGFPRPDALRKPNGAGPARVGGPQATSGMSEYETTADATYSGGGAAAVSSLGAEGPQRVEGECSPHVGNIGQAFQMLSTTDPILIQTSGSDHNVIYSYADGCVNAVHSRLVSRWQPLSGWQLQSHVHDTPFPTYSNWRAVRATGSQTMRNTVFADLFCPLSPGNTYTYYTNTVDAWYDGYPSFSRTAYSTGGCSGLLSSTFYTFWS